MLFYQSVLLVQFSCLCQAWGDSRLRKLLESMSTFFVFKTIDETFYALDFLYLQRRIVRFGQHISDRIDVITSDCLQQLSFLVFVINAEPGVF
jgi:hypothetical protein